MIKVSDDYNLAPGLWSFGGFVRAQAVEAQVQILPTQCDQSYESNSVFTVFVDSEPDITNAHEHFDRQIQARPRALWAVTCSSPTLNYRLTPTATYHSNLVFTTINNPRIPAVEFGPKPWLAHVLLGGAMPNRTELLAQLKIQDLDSQCLINYQPRQFQGQRLSQQYRSIELDRLDSLSWNAVAKDSTGWNSMRPLGTPHDPGWQSQLIAWSVYNSAWLAVVSETENLAWPDTFLPSEKIAKPLLVGQPFVVFGCRGFLARLREIGFLTFEPWIDESYDHEPDVTQRIRCLVESIKKFSALTAAQKVQYAREMYSITRHNRDMILNLSQLTQPLATAIEYWLPKSS